MNDEIITGPIANEGKVVTIKRTFRRRECAECGEPATRKHTFLLEHARSNPGSAAYGHDDCSWCSDYDKFACEEHAVQIRREPPTGMSWCSTFPCNERFQHMFLYPSDEVTP